MTDVYEFIEYKKLKEELCKIGRFDLAELLMKLTSKAYRAGLKDITAKK